MRPLLVLVVALLAAGCAGPLDAPAPVDVIVDNGAQVDVRLILRLNGENVTANAPYTGAAPNVRTVWSGDLDARRLELEAIDPTTGATHRATYDLDRDGNWIVVTRHANGTLDSSRHDTQPLFD